MKKIFFSILLISLLLSACGGNNAISEEPVVDEAATAVAEVLYATQTAIAAEKAAAEVVEVTEEVSASLNTDYTDAAPIYTQLIVGLLKLKDTEQAVTADQAGTLISLLSSLADMTPENTITEDSINEIVNQALAVLSNDQIQAISAMQITQESSKTVLQDLGLETNGMDSEGQSAEGLGGPGGDGGEPPSGEAGQGGPGGGGGAPGNPGEGGEGGEAPSGDQEMDRGIMIQPQLIQALIEYLQSVSA